MPKVSNQLAVLGTPIISFSSIVTRGDAQMIFIRRNFEAPLPILS